VFTKMKMQKTPLPNSLALPNQHSSRRARPSLSIKLPWLSYVAGRHSARSCPHIMRQQLQVTVAFGKSDKFGSEFFPSVIEGARNSSTSEHSLNPRQIAPCCIVQPPGHFGVRAKRASASQEDTEMKAAAAMITLHNGLGDPFYVRKDSIDLIQTALDDHPHCKAVIWVGGKDLGVQETLAAVYQLMS
jgi:hypothetical protein